MSRPESWLAATIGCSRSTFSAESPASASPSQSTRSTAVTWAVAIDQTLGVRERGGAAAPGSDPFSLGEPPTVRRILAAAGFAESEFRDVDVPVYYGQDVDAALAFVGRFANVSEALSRSGPRAAGTMLARLRATLGSRASERGVWLSSRAWIVTARRR